MRMNKIELPEEKGVYVLFFRCMKNIDVRVGSFGTISLQSGIYAYAGSACGGGGIKKRVARHLRTDKKCRWHIDYIRRHMTFEGMWHSTAGPEMEHVAAEMFEAAGASVPMKGFGSSDCRCTAHLFVMSEIPAVFAGFTKTI